MELLGRGSNGEMVATFILDRWMGTNSMLQIVQWAISRNIYDTVTDQNKSAPKIMLRAECITIDSIYQDSVTITGVPVASSV